jgi:hypothetical protein
LTAAKVVGAEVGMAVVSVVGGKVGLATGVAVLVAVAVVAAVVGLRVNSTIRLVTALGLGAEVLMLGSSFSAGGSWLV